MPNDKSSIEMYKNSDELKDDLLKPGPPYLVDKTKLTKNELQWEKLEKQEEGSFKLNKNLDGSAESVEFVRKDGKVVQEFKLSKKEEAERQFGGQKFKKTTSQEKSYFPMKADLAAEKT